MEEKLDMQSPDWVNKNSQFIAERFPNCVTETAEGIKVDFELLKQELSNDIIEGNKERYRLEWSGKREAIVTANLPTTKTLRPVREDSVDFDNTENLYIEGDNLEVLKLLQESYLGKIKMIYIDPPYNTGKDFVYKDNFSKDAQEELEESGQKDEYNQRLVANPETAGRYHSDWLSMMYPRLKLARNLLTDDGVIFISIDDNEVHNLRKICDELFGELNFLACVSVVSNLKGRSDDKYFATSHNSMLVYKKTSFTTRGIPLPEEYLKDYKENDENLGKYRTQGLRKRGSGAKREDRPNMFYSFYVNPSNNSISLDADNEFYIEVLPKLSDGTDGRWRWGKETARARITELVAKEVGKEKRYDIFQKDFLIVDGKIKTVIPKSVWLHPKFANEAGTLEVKSLLNSK